MIIFMKTFLPILLAILVCSCSATLPPKKVPQKAPVNVEQELKSAKASFDSGDTKKALARLNRIVKQYPDSDVADDAHFLMGNIYYSHQAYEDALKHYRSITNGEFQSPLETEANIRSVRTLLRLSNADEAEQVLKHADQWSASEEQAFELDRLRYEVYSALNKHLESLQPVVALGEKHPLPNEREKFRALAQEILESKLSFDDLREVARNDSYGFLQPQARYRYALLLADQRQFSRARDVLASVAETSGGTELGERARTLIQQIDARNRVDSKTIGVVLPLSGKQSGIGYKALRGIQLGLGIYGQNPSKFRLAIVDSEGNPDGARRAIEKLVLEDHVVGIIGGLLSRTVTAEASKAQEFGVPTIMLSQKAGITQSGDSIFRNALTSQMQVQYLVDIAMGQLGYKNFAVIFPNDAYGVEYSNLFWDEVKARGGTIVGAQPYDPKETDFRGHIQRLVGLFYSEDRAEEYRLRTKAWMEKNQKRSSRKAAPSIEEILPPIVDFDAIFIPDSARAVGQIAPMLAYNNVHNVRLLGTNLWNSVSLVNRGQRFVENAVFVDSFLSTDPSFQQSEFFSNFKSTFHEEPGLTELQAYDSALIMRQILASGVSSRVSLQEKMSNIKNFPGAIGTLSVTDEREFRRPLTSLTIQNGQIKAFESIQN